MPITRYGLHANPFGGDLVNPLDCPKNLSHYVTIEGFADQKPDIDAWAAASANRSQFFLIYGLSGTGRTSIANYIAGKFGVEKRILKVIQRVKNDDHIATLHDWMETFSAEADWNDIEKIPEYFKKINTDTRADKYPVVAKYRNFLKQSLLELKAKNDMCLVAIFEDVKNPQLFSHAQDTFDSVDSPYPDPILVIFTISNENLCHDFHKLNPMPKGLPPIELRPLSGDDVLEFIKQRWKQVQAIDPQPFHEQTVVKVFNIKQYPLRRAIQALEFIFNKKLSVLGAGAQWPNDGTLLIDRGDIPLFLIEFESKHPN